MHKLATKTLIFACLAAIAAGRLLAQAGAESRPNPPSSEDLLTLIDVGVPDEQILEFLDGHGWPEDMTPEGFAPAFRSKISPRLRAAILDHLYDGTGRRDLADRFRVFEREEEPTLSVLFPRMLVAQTSSTDPLCVEFHPPKDSKLFIGTRYFAFLLPVAESAMEASDAVLKRGVFESIVATLKSLKSSQTVFDAPVETVLSDAASKKSWPLLLMQTADGASHRPGLIAACVVRRPRTHDLLVLGLATGPDVAPRTVRPFLDDLAVMAGSAR